MFRFRLAVVIVVSFGFVLVLGIALYWGSNQVDKYFQRSQAAYESFDHYERLSQEAYRHFKQRMDRLITNSPTAETGVESSKQRLYEAMQALRDNAVKSSTPEAEVDPDKAAELERVAHFTAFLDASEYRFDEIEKLRQEGKLELAVQALSTFSEEEIDGKFQPLIDTAISAERDKAGKAKQELEELVARSRWIAILASLAAAVFSISSGILLLRGVRKPIDVLLQGTDEIASGNLDHRISLETRDEFAYLASHFNDMAQELALQQTKLREGRAVLEKRVAERTFELHDLNDELKRMDNARREFLADISHELRTPITVIRGEAEVTLRGQDRDTAEYKDSLQRIVELSMQLGQYVNDLMFIARSETANFQFNWGSVNLTDIVTSAVEDFQVMAEESKIAVTLNAPPEPIWVRGDKQRLRQVLFILGDNACRYSIPGGRITVSLGLEASEVKISLTDQGIGIPSQDLERIFERNFRSDNAQHAHDDGSGLGLPMAKSIIKAHDGIITVSSAENVGSTFTLILPLLPKEQDNEQRNNND
ncbi:MAG: HAMP domain-containing sensor histidine kinase [Methylococcaceae bacterium]|nr:HAMP domain-containing sensor histidine kinase [Methylococcaceae bacterium]MDZ4155531.1 HAMP domain-containing sensor histidine kinase [Methylococcales bacterium]MDP2395254.1 HAMP domain-containing sensor histidine kinase [Methylococcaceae bacterium]MDP3020634.1 HAMP domain-containing sensor histidine kinase [Methylococcaceae bacterium]MDP3390073.1 HAMP domain-containing sensor histidine kinase [Methylococcaceae bacterium]